MAQGFSVNLAPTLKVTDGNPSASADATTGKPDITKTMTTNRTVNIDSGVAGIGIVSDIDTGGSAQVFTSAAGTFIIRKFVKAADALGTSGGILQKIDGSAFAAAGLPAAAAVFKNVMAFCTDGIKICKTDGSAWVLPSAYS